MNIEDRCLLADILKKKFAHLPSLYIDYIVDDLHKRLSDVIDYPIALTKQNLEDICCIVEIETKDFNLEILRSISLGIQIRNAVVHPVKFLFKKADMRAEAKPNDFLPSGAVLILHCFLPQKDRMEIIGDLEEEFFLIFKRDGRRKARFFMWLQAFLSLWPYVKGAAWAATIGRAIGWLQQLRG